jgi:hypothetical protein
MKAQRRRVLDWESLEARALLIGFYDGPSPIPLQVYLNGTIAGSAVVRSAAGGTSYNVSASGKLASLGRMSVTGTVRVVGGVEHGTLSLKSSRNNLTLNFSGPVPSGPLPTSGTFTFQIIEGTGPPPPGTTFTYVREQGVGMIQTVIAPGPKPGRAAIAFVFNSH